jgi:CBS domain-containing protein
MREHRVGCLPVVEGDQLVGIVTSYDFLEASARLFEEHLGRTTESVKTRTMAQTA